MTALGRTGKTILFVIAAGTVSVTSLTLPVARVVAAALPVTSSRPFSSSSLREIVRQSNAQFADLAADVACAYLKKFGAAQDSTPPAKAHFGRGQDAPKAAGREAEPTL